MQHVLRVEFAPRDRYLVAPFAGRIERRIRRRNRDQLLQITGARSRINDRVSVPFQEQRAHDPMNEIGSCHISVRLDVHDSGNPVFDADISAFGVLHQVDAHRADQPRECINTRDDLWALCKRRVTRAFERFPFFGVCHPNDAALLLPRGLPARGVGVLLLAHSSNHSLAFFSFSFPVIICTHAKTDASNRSILCVGLTFSYCTASSVFSTARTFATQYSYASECK